MKRVAVGLPKNLDTISDSRQMDLEDILARVRSGKMSDKDAAAAIAALQEDKR